MKKIEKIFIFIFLILIANLLIILAINFDVNGDSSTDIDDLISLATYYRGTYNATYDFNGDSSVDLFDVVALAKNISIGAQAISLGFDPSSNGFTNIVNRPFNTKASTDGDRGSGSFPNKTGGSEGWDGIEYSQSNWELIDDASAPYSPSKVFRITYLEGLAANTEPGTIQTQSFTGSAHGNLQFTELYVKTNIKLNESYWVGSVYNKLYFHRTNVEVDRPEPFIALGDNGDDTFKLAVNFQGTPDNGLGWFFANGTGTSIEKDTWYQIETYLKINDVENANGTFQMWLDGELVLSRNNVNYTWNSDPLYWSALHIAPTFGGQTGNPNNVEFHWFIDQADVWGKE